MDRITVESIIEILNSLDENIMITGEQADEDLTALGVDSIVFIKFIVAMEEEFDCEIPDSKLILSEMNSVSKIYEALKEVIYV